jgi:hypothetical protein
MKMFGAGEADGLNQQKAKQNTGCSRLLNFIAAWDRALRSDALRALLGALSSPRYYKLVCSVHRVTAVLTGVLYRNARLY